MIFLEVLLEGHADVPVLRHLLTRRFGLIEGEHFRLHPHQGKGRLPSSPLAVPELHRRGLLDQLPAKLRGYAYLQPEYWVVVVVDADKDDCHDLKRALVEMYESLPKKASSVIFRIAVEETESWFLADPGALTQAYPGCRLASLEGLQPDEVVGAWERLAQVLGYRPEACSGSEKKGWAERISPFLDFEDPSSPSLRALVDRLARLLEA